MVARHFSRSLFWKLIAPVAGLLFVCAVAITILLPALIQRSAEQEAVAAGQETVKQFNILRKYYTDNVVAKVLAGSDLKVSFDHLGNASTVPLPATMILDLSTLLQESGTTLKLYSPYPFPNRRGRVMDKFGEDAWAFFQRSPERTFSRIEQVGGQSVVRVAMADRMSTPACVACHNSLASSPKRDWKLGDVRGVLEVDSSRQLETGERVVFRAMLALGVMLLVLGAMLRFLFVRSIARPLDMALGTAHALTEGGVEKLRTVESIADGMLERDLAVQAEPAVDRSKLADDEIGHLLRAVLAMSDVQRALDQSIRKMGASLRSSRELERARDWLKSAQNELNTLMRGEQETAMLAESVLFYMAERTGAGVAVLFLHDEQSDELVAAASYAVTRNGGVHGRVARGEGLVGQAAREGRTMVLAEVPPDYLPIGSALGSGTPAGLLVVPLLHGENLVGAIELGSLRPFSAAAVEFVELVRESVAIGFEVNLSRQKTRDLLAETEQQAEELRAQQEELQQSNEELEERADMLERQREQISAKNTEVEVASREIWRKAEELQRVSSYKSEFMANMSHELRTPLNSMLILSGLLTENKQHNLTAKQVEYAATINSAGKDLLNLINDILDLSKVEAGQVEFHYEPAATRELCAAMETMFALQAEQKGLQLHTELAPGAPDRVEIDVQRTLQVLKNLLSNALKFTHAGEITLRIDVPEDGANPLGVPAFACAVSDTGIGVPDDKRDLIFEAFKQADGGISRSYGGTGLGLSISLELARRMGGSLTLASSEGKGSTFTLFLPLAHGPASAGAAQAAIPAPEPAPPTAPPAAPETASGALKRLLIVEDDAHEANGLLALLSGRRVAVTLAATGRQAVDMLAAERFDCMVLDLGLADMSGFDVLAQLQEMEHGRDLPVIVHSGRELTREQERNLQRRAASIIVKGAKSGERLLHEVALALHLADSQPEPARRRQSHGRDAQLEGRKMLIVDDDMRNVFSLTSLLADKGIVVVEAENGKEALAQLAAHPDVCLVLMDIMMPEMDGFEAMRRIRSDPALYSLPIIAMTAKVMQGDQKKCLDAGASDYIAKPIDTDKLMTLLRVWAKQL